MSSIRSKSVTSPATVLFAALAITAPLRAEPSAGDKALADSLFQEGKRLVGAKKYAEACAKLAESQRLDPATGTLLNLAVCHELEGKTATAWVEFGDALVEAKREKRPDRIKLAQDHIAKLETKLPRLTVVVAPDARIQGLVVARDGATLNEAAWGTSFPVDPGTSTISASAPARTTWETRVTLADGEAKTVVVPKLEARAVASATATAAQTSDPSPPASTDHHGRRRTAYVVGGVGVALVAVGGYFGLKTFSQQSDSNDHCSGGACDARGVTASEDAHRSAKFANVGFGLGLVAVGASAYLLLTEPTTSPSAGHRHGPRVGVTPVLAAGHAGVELGGAF